MTTSGTYAFNLSNSSVLLDAFARVGIRRTSLLAEHLSDGAQELNLSLVSFGNRQVNLFSYEQQTIDIVAGTATYTLPSRTLNILSCFIRTGSGQGQNDRIVWPVSTYEYASFANKNAQGFPSVFWFNRLTVPEISFYLTPDNTQTYTAYLQTARQLQDANLPSGETPDVPYRWLDALCSDLAWRLSRIYAPQLEAQRKQDAAEAWAIAATEDTENVPLVIQPAISLYRY